MARLKLIGGNLGERHRFLNKKIKEATNSSHPLDYTLKEDDDIQNLVTIEVAAAKKNVDFILEVYKSEDILYVSRAIKRTTWLITDNKYAHIIQLNYLYNELFPRMTTTAVKKLLLNIRLHLKDEARVEEFYKYLIVIDQDAAFKWLVNCSVTFIEKEVEKHCDSIPIQTCSKILKKSMSIFNVALRATSIGKHYIIGISEPIIRNDPERYLDIIEMIVRPRFLFRRRVTRRLMTKCPNRILEQFHIYYNILHIPTVLKYIKNKVDIQEFLVRQARNDKVQGLFRDDYINHILKHIPRDNRMNLIKMLREITMKLIKDNNIFYGSFYNSKTFYQLYKFASFQTAFENLKKLLRTESSPQIRNSMMLIILSSACNKMENIHTILKYYYEKHLNEPYKFKIEFINTLVTQTDTHKFNDELWNLLDTIFHSLEVYINAENNAHTIVNAIIVRYVIRGVKVPQSIESKFVFNTLRLYEKKIKDQKDRDAVFTYLYNYIFKDIHKNKLINESEVVECIRVCNKLLIVLRDWKKDIEEYPVVLSKIQQLIEINKENHYKLDLSSFYNTNKEWRRTLFEESIILSPNDQVFMNALKHDSNLLQRNNEYVENLFFKDKTILKQTLRKIRIYWPEKAEELKALYLKKIHLANYKAIVTGICTLLPKKELNIIVEKFAPTHELINWNETEEYVYYLRKHIAKTVCVARPLFSIDLLLQYAKGDYLQHAIPSLCAILSRLSLHRSKQCISKILNAPVSLQKFGIRYAFTKFNTQDLIPTYSEIWSSTTNASIRTVLLTNMRSKLCQEKDQVQVQNLWKILSSNIDDLTHEENGIIYRKLADLLAIPASIQNEYFTKVYKFLASLPKTKNLGTSLDEIKCNALEIDLKIDLLDDQLIMDIFLNSIQEKIENNWFFWNDDYYFASYILKCKEEEVQIRRCNKFLIPLLDSLIPRWEEKTENEFRIRNQIQSLLKMLIKYFKIITINKKMAIPLKVFQEIRLQLEKHLTYEKNYIFLTYWKLAVEMIRLFEENKQVIYEIKDIENIDGDDKVLKNLGPSFAEYCVKIINEDLIKFHPSINRLFSLAMYDLFDDFIDTFGRSTSVKLYYVKCLLEHGFQKEIYLTVGCFFEKQFETYRYYNDNEKTAIKEIQDLIFSYPSNEYKMHAYNLFSGLFMYVPK